MTKTIRKQLDGAFLDVTEAINKVKAIEALLKRVADDPHVIGLIAQSTLYNLSALRAIVTKTREGE